MNPIRKIDKIKTYGKAVEKKRIKALYIEADEDHIHYQNERSGIIKLVYVHEGKKHTVKDRNELISPKYFSGVYDGERVEKLWEVWEYIYKSI